MMSHLMTDAAADSTALAHRFCPNCGYNLHGIGSDRCPECGTAIDRTVSIDSSIPWTHRKSIGVARAYIRTAALSMFRPSILAKDIARPVSLVDALAFRKATAIAAAAPVFLVIGTMALTPGIGGGLDIAIHPSTFAPEWIAAAAFCLGLWLFFYFAAGVASYWFHPRGRSILQQNRAVALGYYSCGPLATMPVIGLIAIVVCALSVKDHGSIPDLVLIILSCGAFGLLVFTIFMWWRTALVMLRRTTSCGMGRTIWLGVGLPLAWVSLAGICIAMIPAICVWLLLLIFSFH